MREDTELASALLGIVAPACAARPDDAAELLREAAAPLARLGFRRAETVMHWLDPEVLPGFAARVETDESGRRWLDQALPAKLELLQQALDDVRAALDPDAITGSGLRDMIANSLQNQARYAEALAVVEELAEEGDPLGLRRGTIAWLRAMLGDPSLALELMDDDTRPHLLRARLAAAVGNQDRAVALLQVAHDHDPEMRPEFEGGFEGLFEYAPYLAIFGPPRQE